MFRVFNSHKSTDDIALEWLSQLESAEISEKQKDKFFRWLDKDEAHQQAYIRAEALWQKTGQLSRYQDGITGKTPSNPFFQNLGLYSGFACACVVLVGVLFFAFGITHTHIAEYRTVVGEQKTIQLADGSQITLNTNAHVRVKLNRSQRAVFLKKGEVLFDIASEEGRPFDVITRSGLVRVVGTVFSVFDNGANTLVTVLEGQVKLNVQQVSRYSLKKMESVKLDGPVGITLNSDQQLALEEASSSAAKPRKVHAKSILAWQNQRLIYNGATLATVLNDVNRYYDIAIEVENDSLLQDTLVGVIVIGDFDRSLRSIKELFQLEVAMDAPNNRAILRKH